MALDTTGSGSAIGIVREPVPDTLTIIDRASPSPLSGPPYRTLL